MRKIRFISVLLALMMLCCSFISCDQGQTEEVTLAEREFYDITVSFQIKDVTGQTKINAKDYNYKSHAKPTIINIVDTYLSVVENWTCKVDKTNTLTQVGGMKANAKNGEFWGFVMPKTDANGNVTMSGINLSMEQIKNNLNSGKMSETIIEDGGEFTIILIAE